MKSLENTFLSTESRASLFMAHVYLRMTLALLASAAIGYASLESGLLLSLFANLGRGLSLAIFGGQVATVLAFQASLFRMKPEAARILFGLYAVITGLTLGLVGLLYQVESIFAVAFLSTTAFASLVAYGKLTKRNLGAIGTFALSALTVLMVYSLGIWAASYIPVLSQIMGTAIKVQAVLGLLIFSAITAYEAQKLKHLALRLAEQGSDEEIELFVTSAALNMFMNFIGLFLSLLRLLGNRK